MIPPSIPPEALPLAAGAFAVGKEIAKNALGPAAKELGEPLRLAVKRMMSGMVKRLQAPAEAHDALGEAVIHRLRERGVSDEVLREPAEELLAQVVFSNLLVGGQSDLREMFAGLLASELDPTRSRSRPALVEVIRQLSSLDAKVFSYLADRRTHSVSLQSKRQTTHGGPVPGQRYPDPGPREGVEQIYSPKEMEFAALFPEDEPGAFMECFDNLRRLSLVEVLPANPGPERVSSSPMLVLTRFGRTLAQACL
jgi:hypothetical protein